MFEGLSASVILCSVWIVLLYLSLVLLFQCICLGIIFADGMRVFGGFNSAQSIVERCDWAAAASIAACIFHYQTIEM